MSEALLCLVLICTPLSLEASFTWTEIASEYPLPPLAVLVQPLGGTQGELAAQTGIDPQGRASVTLDPRLAFEPANIRRKVIAHESFHAMLRARGAPYMGIWEENLANNFAYCWTRQTLYYYPDIPCAQMLFAFHR